MRDVLRTRHIMAFFALTGLTPSGPRGASQQSEGGDEQHGNDGIEDLDTR
jgi:hypothetical protein